MATLVITPSVWAEHGFSEHATVSKASHSTRQTYQPRDVTLKAIRTFVMERGAACSRLEIARAVGLKKSPHVVDMIEELVELGALTRSHYLRANGAICYLYGEGRASWPF